MTTDPPGTDLGASPWRSVAGRAARGRSRRARVPLASHCEVPDPDQRRDPIAILEEQALERIPELLPIRYERMALSAFAFYRGGAAIMAADLAQTPTSGLRAQLCGDAHLMNFGLFETPERTLVFGLNDFDETLPGPIEWDLKRLATSVEIAARDLQMTPHQRRRAVSGTVRAYRGAMARFAGMRNLDVWYARLPADELRRRLEQEAGAASGRKLDRQIRKALRKEHLRAARRLVLRDGDELRFRSDPPILVPVEELLDDEQASSFQTVVDELLDRYRASLPADRRVLIDSYRVVHVARKVVGVGSVGTRAWVVLLLGRDHDDPLILQLKEAQRSVLAAHAGDTACASEGQRVAEGQRLMQAASDHLLGWVRFVSFDGVEHDFYVRQLWDGKGSVELADLSPAGLRAYGESCGWTLARGHARSGDRIALAAYMGEDDELDEAVAAFAHHYADISERDHARLLDAIATGRLATVADS